MSSRRPAGLFLALALALAALPIAGQNSTISNLAHDTTPLPTDKFIVQPLGATRDKYETAADFLGVAFQSFTLALPAQFSCSPSPATATAGAASITCSWAGSFGSHRVLGTFGGSTFTDGALTTADLPAIGFSFLTGNPTAAQLGSGTANSTTFLRGDLTWQAVSSGTVTSVAMTVPSDFSVSGSPITISGTFGLTRNSQNANLVQAGPASGGAAAPTYRALVTADLPTTLFASGTNTVAASASTGTQITATNTDASGNQPQIVTTKNRSGGAAIVGDITGVTIGQFFNSASATKIASETFAQTTNVTSGSEAATYNIWVMGGTGTPGTLASMAVFTGGSTPAVSFPEATTVYQPTIGIAGVAKSSHVTTAGTAPTVSCTGLGSGSSNSIAGTDETSEITMTTGSSGVGTTGICTVTFNSAYVTNLPMCLVSLTDGTGTWNTSATIKLTVQSLTAPQIAWNGAVTLTASKTYLIDFICRQR